MDITDIPMLTARRISEEKRARASAAKRAGSLLCFAFMLISAAAHIFIGASLYLNCEREDLEQAMLFSVLPRRVSQREECTSLQEETTVPPKEETVWDETEKAEPVPHQAESFYLKNETTYNPDLSILFNSPNPISKAPKLYERYGDGAPLVLIYHSHATESYSDTNDSGYYRSCDISKNTVAVGDVIHRCLSANGIGSIHLTEMFDRESYSLAYDKASAAVEKTLKETPSIQYILDVHRDSITDVSGKELSVDFTYGGIAAAQLMFVVGTDEGGSGHADWRRNLTTVLHIESLVMDLSPSALRPVNLRRASFFQHRGPGAMLIEIGSCGNTLGEAKRSAALFSFALSSYILGDTPEKTPEQLLEIAAD